MSVNIPTSMEQEVKDEEDDRKFEVAWKTNETDSFPEYRQTSLRELSEITKDNKITHLRFKDDYPDRLPADVRDSLVCLDIPYKESHAVLSDLPSVRSLTVRRDDGGYPPMDPYQLNSQLSMFKSLNKLTLKGCIEYFIPQSISDLTELEELILPGNYLGRDDHLNETLNSLKKLKKLDLSNNVFSAVPSSISKLTELEELILPGNHLSDDNDLGVTLSNLKKLKKLDLSNCNLSAVPSSICTLDQLEHLLIKGNKDLCKDKSLNSKLSRLKSLKTLDIDGCGLKEIPSGIKEMTQLTDLNMAWNEFSDDSIPTWFTELCCLKILDISGFKTLKKLSPSLVSLTKLNCAGCTALLEPPYFVCYGGLNNVEQYYKDMEAGPKHSMTLSTIVVIGRKMAGKSSLVKSLTQKEIVGTLRDNFASGFHQGKKDETTKVFDLAQLKLTSKSNDDEYTVNVIDFGGDEIYHSAYLLTFRKDCIPAVVVNMEEYEKMSRQWGPREAARRLVFEWIAHLYLACPDVGDPILVLTHIDTLLIPKSACSYRDELVKTLDELLSDLKNQNAVSEKIGFFQRGFAACEICEIRHDKPYNEVYKELESIICNRVGSSSVSLPNSWKEIITHIKGRETATLDYETLRHDLSIKGTSEKQLDVVLDFMQRSGEILRYQNTHMFPLGSNEILRYQNTHMFPLGSNDGKDDDYWGGEFPLDSVYGSNNREDYDWENSVDSIDSAHIEDGDLGEDSNNRDDSNNREDTHIKEDSDNSEDSDDEEANDTRDDRNSREDNEDHEDSDDANFSMSGMDDMVCRRTGGMDDMVCRRTGGIDDIVYGMTGSTLYGNEYSLEGIIFHRVSEITKIIKLLFDHSISEYKGIVKAETLRHLLTPTTDADNNINADTAIELLKAFNIIHGPKSYNSNPRCYLIPQFMSPHEFPAPTGEIQLRTDMNFVGLSIPRYAYQQSTVTVLSSLPESYTQFFPYGNGISCRVAKSPSDPLIDIHLIHEIVEQRIILRVEGCSEVITDMWRYLLNLIKYLTSSIRGVWPASKITYELPCSHCLITNKLNPEKRTNPDFIIQASEGEIDKINYSTAQERTKCGNETLPAALRLPVKSASLQDLELLKAEVKTLKGGEDLQTILERQGNVLNLQPVSQTVLYSHQVSIPKVYQMTPSRGRALIINNKDTKIVNGSQERGRKGSENDYTNVRTMFESFGFVISELSGDRDWTGKEMVDAIHQETQYVDRDTGSSVYDCLGMFVLVLMSHGGLGTIAGCDGKSLRLKDIYGLLSSYNFQAMKGKPKLIILQACSGGEKERPEFIPAADSISGQSLTLTNYGYSHHSISQDTIKISESNGLRHCPPKPLAAEHQTHQAHASLSSDVVPDPAPPVESRPVPNIPLPSEVDLENSHLSVDDLLIMKPSFDDFLSFRDEDQGSYFIRAVAAAFYIYAAEKDIRTLADTTIQEAVRAESKRLTQQMLRHTGQVKERQAGQVPVTACTFTKERKLYLSPGVNMRTSHPESITNPRLPDRMTTVIRWQNPDTNTPRFDAVPNPSNSA